MLPDVQVDLLRANLNKVVLAVFLPALNFNVVYQTKIGYEFWQLPILAALGVFISVLVAGLVYSLMPVERRIQGALIIGCAFSNVTYFGIAVLQGLFPENSLEVVKVAVLFEITITPISVIVGAAVASIYSNNSLFSWKDSLLSIAKMPLLWATFVALFLNLCAIPLPGFVTKATTILASTVSGLMILSLGMALKYPVLKKSLRQIHYLLPVIIIKLFFSPFIMYWGVKMLGVQYPYSQAAIIEAAMPSQLISLVIADRYKLDTEVLAVAIAVDTVFSFISIPICHYLMVYYLA
jgi:predicted permease